jgi:hypothetical protein
MKKLSLGGPQAMTGQGFDTWVLGALRQIERASLEDATLIADAFAITGTFTETRTLNVTTPTTANIAAVLATFLDDLKKRGAKRT